MLEISEIMINRRIFVGQGGPKNIPIVILPESGASPALDSFGGNRGYLVPGQPTDTLQIICRSIWETRADASPNLMTAFLSHFTLCAILFFLCATQSFLENRGTTPVIESIFYFTLSRFQKLKTLKGLPRHLK